MKQGVLERYREYLPVNDSTPILSLGEGDTPLVRSRAIEGITGCGELYFKLEGCNPTGSFKDRGMVVAVAKAMEADCKSIVCASTGNTSASAAAYGAYCGMSTTVLVPKGNVARGKLTQAIAYGARVALIDGSFDSALKLVRVLSERLPLVVVNSVNPTEYRDRRRPRSRLSTIWGAHRTRFSFLLATPATSPPTGSALRRRTRWAGRRPGLR